MTPRKTQPVLLGGAFIGVLSALPIIAIGNLFCCLWIVGGGVIAAYLMQQSHPVAITLQDGAVGGFLAGIVGAFVYVIVAVPVQLLMAPIQRRVAQGILDAARTVPPEFRDMIEEMSSGAGGVIVGLMIMFFVLLVLGVIFATLGGVLGALMFRRNPEPPTPSPTPQPLSPGL